jgi:hypothetical protein
MIVVSYRPRERCAKPDSSLSGSAKFKKLVGRSFRNANRIEVTVQARAIGLGVPQWLEAGLTTYLRVKAAAAL